MAITLKLNAQGFWVLPIKVTPKASHPGCIPWAADQPELGVKVSAPPDKGQANTAVLAVVSKALNLPKSAVVLLKGDTSRHKQLGILASSSQDLSDRVCQAWQIPPEFLEVV